MSHIMKAKVDGKSCQVIMSDTAFSKIIEASRGQIIEAVRPDHGEVVYGNTQSGVEPIRGKK